MSAKGLGRTLNAIKHGVSKHGLLFWETEAEYNEHVRRWRDYLKPHGPILEDLMNAIVSNRWRARRNELSVAIFVAKSALGRAAAERGVENLDDALKVFQQLFDDRDAKLDKFARLADTIRNNAAEIKNDSGPGAEARRKSCQNGERIAKSLEAIGNQYKLQNELFLGIGEEIEKQAQRQTLLDGQFAKLIAAYFNAEQCLDTRSKLLPATNRVEDMNVMRGRQESDSPAMSARLIEQGDSGAPRTMTMF